MWYPLPAKIRNSIWDLLFYDVRSLTHFQFYGGMDPFVEQGAIIVIGPDSELHSCKGFRLFGSEKVGKDRLETNRLRAEDNVRALIEEYDDSIDTVALAGCGSSLIGAAAFAKSVAKARNKPVAAIVTGLGMRDLMGEILSGALLFQPSNLASGFIDFFLDKNRELQARMRTEGTEYAEAVSSTFSSLSGEPQTELRETEGALRKRTQGAAKVFENAALQTEKTVERTTNVFKNVSQQTEEIFKDAVLKGGDFLPSDEDKSLTELFLHPDWLERQIMKGALKGKALDDLVCSIPACATLLELLRQKPNKIDLLVGHSKGAYAINLVAWGMICGSSEDNTREMFKKTVNIATFGCGVRLPKDLEKCAYQYIGEWDILGNLNTPGFHLPFLPKSISLPGVKETIKVNWQKRTLHTTSTSMLFGMPVSDILMREILPTLGSCHQGQLLSGTQNTAPAIGFSQPPETPSIAAQTGSSPTDGGVSLN